MKGNSYFLDAEKVRAAMLRCGKSKEQIVNDSGFGKATINHAMNPGYCRSHAFAHSTILAVAAAIGCTAADLLADGTNTPASAPKPAQRPKAKQSDLFVDPAKKEAINQMIRSWQDYVTATNNLINSMVFLLERR